MRLTWDKTPYLPTYLKGLEWIVRQGKLNERTSAPLPYQEPVPNVDPFVVEAVRNYWRPFVIEFKSRS